MVSFKPFGHECTRNYTNQAFRFSIYFRAFMFGVSYARKILEY